MDHLSTEEDANFRHLHCHSLQWTEVFWKIVVAATLGPGPF